MPISAARPESHADSAARANRTHVEICVAWGDCGRHEFEPGSRIRNDIGKYIGVGNAEKVNSGRRIGNGVAADYCCEAERPDAVIYNLNTCRAAGDLVGGHSEASRVQVDSRAAVCYYRVR